MKPTTPFLKILILCIGILFFSKNANALCTKDTTLSVFEIDSCQHYDVQLMVLKNNSWPTNKSYLWSNGDTSTSTAGLGMGTYHVIITDKTTFCKDTLYYTVVDDTCYYNPCSYFQAYISENDFCGYNDVTLTAYTNYGGSSLAYLWNTGATTASISNKTTGSFWVKVTNGTTGCIDTAFITVVDDTCNPCANFQAWISESDLCAKNDIKLSALPKDSNTSNYSYLWNTGATTSSISNKTTGSYWVKITNGVTGCIDTAFITVVDDTCDPCANFYSYIYHYDSCMTNDISISSNVYGGSGNYSYIWNTGSTSNILQNKGTGWYKVTITDNNTGCVRKDSIYVVDSNFKCCKAYIWTNDSIAAYKTFYGENLIDSASTNYSWDFGDGTTGSGKNITHTYNTSGNKTVCLYTLHTGGCKDTVCINVMAPSPGKNLKVSHYGSSYIIPINLKYTYIYYKNIGTTTETATIEYSYPAGSSINYSSISPTSNTGNKATYNVGSIAPGTSGYIYINLYVPNSYSTGTYKCDTARILTLTGDIDVSDNTSLACHVVASSYDPNDKMPNPVGAGTEGTIDPATKEINYLIRFQNNGNWRTYKVRVEDEIDPSFDINSLAIGDVSHEFRLVKSGRKLTWYFDDIELTPKSQNEAKSQGYIQYTLKLNPNLPLNTQIKNTAYIYFDNNPAIITNTTKNTLKSSTGNAAVRDSRADQLDFDVTKTDAGVQISSKSKIDRVNIYDMNGKLLRSKSSQNYNADIHLELNSTGVYIIHVEVGDSVIVKKFQF